MDNQHFTAEEQKYSEATLDVIRQWIETELADAEKRKSDILEARKYFADYFHELKGDEKRDLLSYEELDTKSYFNSMNFLARLAKQLKEPYFAAFNFKPQDEDDDEEPIACYLSIQTLRDPQSGEIMTYDWRAPIASLYYESEPGKASFKTPDGEVSGTLSRKRRFVFKRGALSRCTEIDMPSDDEMLSEALSRNTDGHMHAIVQTLQREQHIIIREHIEGITVICGCAGSGKTSVALHKAAYILYGFRDRMKDSSLAIISPNDVFSEYISTVLPDLGEDNIMTMLPEDVVRIVMGDSAPLRFVTRAEEAELIGESALSADTSNMRICREAKASEAFRTTVLKYAKHIRNVVFQPEEMFLTTVQDATIDAETLNELFYVMYNDVPLLKRTAAITEHICKKHDIRLESNKEYIQNTLDGMMTALTALDAYKLMYTDKEFVASISASDANGASGEDMASFALYDNLFEDACAVAILHLELTEPDELPSVFYLLCDEAQDFSPIFLELLRICYRGCNMLFVGDADQIVFGNSGHFTDDIARIMTRRPLRRYELATNYRSTSEIVEYAIKVLGREAHSIKSVRSGREPLEISVTDGAKGAEAVREAVKAMSERGLERVAVITRTRGQAERLQVDVNLPQSLLSRIDVRFIPVYMAKGLEYDGVIVWDADAPYYATDEGRLVLYTACTRALHELVIVNLHGGN